MALISYSELYTKKGNVKQGKITICEKCKIENSLRYSIINRRRLEVILNYNLKLNIMKKLALALIIGLLSFEGIAQGYSQKSSIAVANPHVQGLSITSEVAAKLIQLELIKLNKFSVYDEFDMAEVIKENDGFSDNCYGLSCLSKMGQALKVDYIISGSFDGLGNKIAISLKWIDVKSGTLYKSMVKEFDNQEGEIQRMVEIILKEMNGVEVDAVLKDRLRFNNEVITSNNIGRINNSGPRIGYGFMAGSLAEFATRPRNQGGLDIFPGVSMIGYQVEKQYVGTENFSALVEGIFNVSGLEQGTFIPSITILNGFRFGKAGWELAFGPGFGLKRTTKGFFDTENRFGKGNDFYFREIDWANYANDNFRNNDADSLYYNDQGIFTNPTPSDVSGLDYSYVETLDARGDFKLTTTFLFAFGRTFRAGALNIPVNVFYSSSRKGGMGGMSLGFNVQTQKKNINPVSL